MGRTESEIREAIFGTDIEERYDRGEMSSEEFLDRLGQFIGLDNQRDAIRRAWVDIFWPNEAVIAVIGKLSRASYRLVLASNTNELHYEWFCEQFAEPLKHFARLVVSHEIGVWKPERRFFEHVVEAAGCPASDCVYIDDKEPFVAASRLMGMAAIQYHPELDLTLKLKDLGASL